LENYGDEIDVDALRAVMCHGVVVIFKNMPQNVG
jgi:hypothetical protein